MYLYTTELSFTLMSQYSFSLRRLEEMRQENEELRLLLERERSERKSVVTYYTNFIANSEACKKKHDSAVDEYNKYQIGRLQERINELEKQVAVSQINNNTSSNESEDEGEEAPAVVAKIPLKFLHEPSDVVDLDSDD